jgi:MtN3 and saliva related transmembrane protein
VPLAPPNERLTAGQGYLGLSRQYMAINQELIGYAAAALTTLSFLPQAIMTLKTRDTSSLSLGMYALFTLGVLCWLIYGILLANTPIIIANALTLLLAACILSVKIYHTFFQKR